MTIDLKKVGKVAAAIVSFLVIGGAVFGVVASVKAYFATKEQLRIVDCYQYYSTESLGHQTNQIRLLPMYRDRQRAAADAQISHEKNRENAKLLADYKEAVRVQNEVYEKLKKAQDLSTKALKEQEKCGHQGPEQLQS